MNRPSSCEHEFRLSPVRPAAVEGTTLQRLWRASRAQVPWVLALCGLTLGCETESREALAPTRSGQGEPAALLNGDLRCQEGSVRDCHEQLPRQGAVLSCFQGKQHCNAGRWSACEAQPGDGKPAGVNLTAGLSPLRPGAAFVPGQPCGPSMPCDPTCHLVSEEPAGGLVADGGLAAPWPGGALEDFPPSRLARALGQPCQLGEQCQMNHHCAEVATQPGCGHSKCRAGGPLAQGCDPCVAKVCASHPECCTERPDTCEHELCETGVPLAGSCDSCAATICAARPSCCNGSWDSTCVAMVQTSCGRTCPCAPDELLGPDRDRCYFRQTSANSWDGARAACQARGADWDLVTPNSPQEDRFVGQHETSAIWMGLRDDTGSGDFRWVDGSPPWYFDWNYGEPNNQAGREHCGERYAGGHWNDQYCGDTLPSWCEGPAVGARQWTQTCVAAVATSCQASCSPQDDVPEEGVCQPWLPGQTSACASWDVAVGVPCETTLPLCNHGTVPAPAGLDVMLFAAGSGEFGRANPDASQATRHCTTTATIPPGSCISLDGCITTTTAVDIFVNSASQAGECVVSDNWGMSATGNRCAPPDCSGITSIARSRHSNLLLMIDRSASMDGPAFESTKLALADFVTSPTVKDQSVALRFFPDDTPSWGCNVAACDEAACASPLVALGTLSGSSSGAQATALLSSVAGKTAGGSSPLYAALDGALLWGSQVAQAHPQELTAVVLVTKGIRSRCNTSSDELAARAREAYEHDGVLTYVVGLPGGDPDLIDQVALAGGTRQGLHISQLDGGTSTELLDALGTITEQRVKCSFPLPDSQFSEPSLTSVLLQSGATRDGLTAVASAGDCGEGWYFDAANPTRLTLCPSTCQRLQRDPRAELQVEMPCRASFTGTTVKRVYEGQCPDDASPIWTFFTYDARTPGDSNIVMRARTANSEAALPSATFVDLITASRANDTERCSLGGPSPCPVNLYEALHGDTGIGQYLELEVQLHPSSAGNLSPQLRTWKLNYSCPASK